MSNYIYFMNTTSKGNYMSKPNNSRHARRILTELIGYIKSSDSISKWIVAAYNNELHK